MSDEKRKQTLRDQQAKGADAALVLRTLDEVFKELDLEAYSAFVGSDPHDAEGREALHDRVAALQQLREKLHMRVRQGEDARKEMVRDKRDEIKVV